MFTKIRHEIPVKPTLQLMHVYVVKNCVCIGIDNTALMLQMVSPTVIASIELTINIFAWALSNDIHLIPRLVLNMLNN